MTLPAQKNTHKNIDSKYNFHKFNYLKVSQAAKILGVSSSSLRRLEEEGKITSERLPGNNYRVYRLDLVNQLKTELNEVKKLPAKEKKAIREAKIKAAVIPETIEIKPIATKNDRTVDKFKDVKEKSYARKPSFRFSFGQSLAFVSLFITLLSILYLPANLSKGFAQFRGLLSSLPQIIKLPKSGGKKINNGINISEVLAARTRVADFTHNFNLPVFFKKPATFEQGITTTGITFNAAGLMNNLLGIDAITKTTLETSLELDGEVTAIDLMHTVIADGVIDETKLASEIAYDGDFDFAGTWAIGGSVVDATAEEINILSSATVTQGGVIFGDGTKFTQDVPSLFWDSVNKRLGIGTSSPMSQMTITPNSAGAIQINPFGSLAGNTGELRFTELVPNGDNYIGFKAPDSLSENIIFTLPSTSAYEDYVLTWQPGNQLTWSSSNGDISSVGSIESGRAFSDTSADGQWLGLGSSAGRIAFENQATDEINFLDANIGIGTTTPSYTLDVNGTLGVTGEITGTQSLTLSQDIIARDQLRIGDANNTVFNYIANDLSGATSAMNTNTDLYIQGDLEVNGNIVTGTGSGTMGYWRRDAPTSTLSPIYSGDTVSIPGAFIVENTGTFKTASATALIVQDLSSDTFVVDTVSDIVHVYGALTSTGAITGPTNTNTINGIVISSGNILSGTWSGDNISLAKGGTGASLSDPNEDKIMFWDDSVGSTGWLGAGSGILISGTTISATTSYSAGNGLSLDGTTFKLGGQLSDNTRIYDSSNREIIYLNNSTGNIGIGTTNPTYKLQVAGSFMATDYAAGDGTIGASSTVNGLVFKNGLWTSGSLPAYLTAETYLGDITDVGSMTTGIAFGDTSADNQWLGLGATMGRIEFDDQTIDEVNILNSYVGIGTSTPTSRLEIIGSGSGVTTSSLWTKNLAGVTGLFVNDLGNVGIGTTAPGVYSLNVAGSFMATDYFSGDGTLGASTVVGGLEFKDGLYVSGTFATGGTGDITDVGSMTTGIAFGDTSADNQWLGLGATMGRIEFDDQDTDEVNILNARLGVGTSTPQYTLDVNGSINGITITTGNITAGTWSAGVIGVPYGGTGAATLTAAGILVGNGTGPVSAIVPGTTGQLLLGVTGSNPAFATLGGDATIAADGTLTLGLSGVTAGTYGDATHIPRIVVDNKGRITSVVSTTISYETPLTFSNGLTRATNDIKLGGTFTETTTLTAGNFDMIFNLNGTGDFRVQDNGVDKLFISDGGLIGMGTTAPTSRLEIIGSGSSSSTSSLWTKNLAGTTGLFVRDDGNVGIGTTDPDYKLHINRSGVTDDPVMLLSSTNDGQIRLQSTASAEQYIEFMNSTTNTDAWMAGMDDDETYRIAYGTAGEIADNNTKFIIDQNGDVGIGTTNPGAALDVVGSAIIGAHDGNDKLYINRYGSAQENAYITAGDIDRDTGVGLTFQTRNSAGGTFDALVLSQGGVDNPLMLLSSTGDGQIRLESAASAEQYIEFMNSTTEAYAWMAGMDDDETYRIAYGTAGEIADNNTKFIIDQNGDVGIGTTNPTSRLEIVGSGSGSATSSLWTKNLAGVTGLFIRDDGYLGVGTTAPTSKLDLGASTLGASSLRIRAGTAPSSPNEGDTYSDGTTVYFWNGSSWIDLGNGNGATKLVLNAEYAGAVLAADASNNTGTMTADNAGSANSWMNYYEWTSSEASLQDYDIRVRFTLPTDFVSWQTSNAIQINLVTESDSAVSNKIDASIYLSSSAAADASITAQVSSAGGTWTTGTIDDSELGDCNAADETCILILKLYSKDDNYARVGDIILNYNR